MKTKIRILTNEKGDEKYIPVTHPDAVIDSEGKNLTSKLLELSKKESPTPIDLPIASQTQLGAIRVGNGLTINNTGLLSTTGGTGGTGGTTGSGGLPIKGLLSDYVSLTDNFGGYFNSTLVDGIYFILKNNLPTDKNPPFINEDFVLIHRKISMDSNNWAHQEVYALTHPELKYERRILMGSQKTDGRQQEWQYTGGDEKITRLSNKKMLTIGDSIFAKWAGDPTDATSSTPSLIPFRPQDNTAYPGQTMYHVGLQAEIFKHTKMDIKSLARGGARIARTRAFLQWDNYSFHKLASVLDFSKFDVLLVGYGTNDAGNMLPVGTIDSTDDTTTAGAMNLGIPLIYQSNPNIQLFFSSPIPRMDSGGSNNWAVKSWTDQQNGLKPYVNMIHAICDKWGIPCFDGYKMSGINKYNYAKYLNTDMLHVDDYSLWGSRMSEWLKQYL